MSATALKAFPTVDRPLKPDHEKNVLASDLRYVVRLAANASEIAGALRLRHEVFNIELGVPSQHEEALEFDQFDLRCKHLIATERSTGRIIGTYRVNTIGPAEGIDKFYSHAEFTLETLPESILRNSVETGRACVASDHRGSKALFLLWKGLAQHLLNEGKSYIFGCCSIFTSDPALGARAFKRLAESGHVSTELFVTPRTQIEGIDGDVEALDEVTLPPLFEMYLRLGAKVCGPPMYDDSFGSIDFLVVLDLESIDDRHRRIFFR